jgi:endoglucanase
MKQVLLLLACVPLFAAAPTTEIKVDQVGYSGASTKVALVVSKTPAKAFTVRRASNNSVAFRGELSAPVADSDSGDNVQAADFTKLTQAGKYYIDVPDAGRSWTFSIGSNVYSRAYYLAMRSFYGQRCGIAVDLGKEFPGFKHEACHLEGGYHASFGKTGAHVSKGGWHDAGDYGRYVVNSGISTGTLLWAWEMFTPQVKNVKLNLPETGNGKPDMLNEIKWNLDWMLTMQDDDGGVWHKQTSEKFCDFIMPEKDTLVSYVIGSGRAPFKTSCATADFVAVMAIAARTYKPYDAAYSTKVLRAAQQAWTWVEKNPNAMFNNPQGVGTGAYGDRSCGDEMLWAAAELYRTTGEQTHHQYFLQHYAEFRKGVKPIGPQAWANVSNLGLWTYVLGNGKDATAAAAIKQDALAAADAIVKRTNASGYRMSMAKSDWIWGSSSVAANYGMQLLVANAFQKNPAYVSAAVDNLHYLLGRNALSLSFVTQVGENPYKHPHHRPSGADANADPWPGMLSGGPNARRQTPPMLNCRPIRRRRNRMLTTRRPTRPTRWQSTGTRRSCSCCPGQWLRSSPL